MYVKYLEKIFNCNSTMCVVHYNDQSYGYDIHSWYNNLHIYRYIMCIYSFSTLVVVYKQIGVLVLLILVIEIDRSQAELRYIGRLGNLKADSISKYPFLFSCYQAAQLCYLVHLEMLFQMWMTVIIILYLFILIKDNKNNWQSYIQLIAFLQVFTKQHIVVNLFNIHNCSKTFHPPRTGFQLQQILQDRISYGSKGHHAPCSVVVLSILQRKNNI